LDSNSEPSIKYDGKHKIWSSGDLPGPIGCRSDGLCDRALDSRGGDSSSVVSDDRGVVERVDISPDVRDDRIRWPSS
jgi:hypothetical protein